VNDDTKKRQIGLWIDVILKWCRHNHQTRVNVDQLAASPLFRNEKINRSLAPKFLQTILDELVKQEKAEWTDVKRTMIVWWRTREEWAKEIMDWSDRRGFTGSICTVYELSDEEEFKGLDKDTLLMVLNNLAQQGKLTLFKGAEDELGIKFA